MDTDVHDALMAAIRQEPEVDLHRLVYADFLEESGHPERAEFVRIQVEIAAEDAGRRAGTRRIDDWQVLETEKRYRDLLLAFGREWFGDTALWLVYDIDAWTSAPGLIISRGFPHTVRCPLDWWIGGVCGGCNGDAVRLIDTSDVYGHAILDSIRCGWCGATGRTPAHGLELVAKWPITKVVATDLRPMRAVDGDWCWVVRADIVVGVDLDTTTTHLIPRYLWDCLDGYDTSPTARVQARRYPSEEAANEALSRALIAWANGVTT